MVFPVVLDKNNVDETMIELLEFWNVCLRKIKLETIEDSDNVLKSHSSDNVGKNIKTYSCDICKGFHNGKVAIQNRSAGEHRHRLISDWNKRYNKPTLEIVQKIYNNPTERPRHWDEFVL